MAVALDRRLRAKERLGPPSSGVRDGDHVVMTRQLNRGDKVTWRSHGGEAVGKVLRTITSRTRAGGRTVTASPQDPQYLVRSDKSGGTAVHKPGALKRKS